MLKSDPVDTCVRVFISEIDISCGSDNKSILTASIIAYNPYLLIRTFTENFAFVLKLFYRLSRILELIDSKLIDIFLNAVLSTNKKTTARIKPLVRHSTNH